jgi:hypothetical protein
MLGRFRDRELELGRPLLRRLPGPGVNQIERVAREDRARDRNRVERFPPAVQAAKFFQRRIVERLHAE